MRTDNRLNDSFVAHNDEITQKRDLSSKASPFIPMPKGQRYSPLGIFCDATYSYLQKIHPGDLNKQQRPLIMTIRSGGYLRALFVANSR